MWHDEMYKIGTRILFFHLSREVTCNLIISQIIGAKNK
jgi:hypothetical protein